MSDNLDFVPRSTRTGKVLVAIRSGETGVESEASVDQRRYFAVTVEPGRIMRVRMFSERADALKAAGLEE